jgi:hypothetical protein
MRTANHSYLATRVVAPLLVFVCTSCLDTASKNNDNTRSVAGASGNAAGTTPAAGAGVGAGGVGAAGESGAPEAGTGEAGMSSTGPDASLVTGTGSMCSSYVMPENGKCGGYFCGVDLATLQEAVDPMAKCGGDADILCRNAVITAVGHCARQEKGKNPAAPNEQLTPLVEACVFQDAELKEKVTSDCLACTITAAECAADNCLGECLAGDSAVCDSCRKMNNCDQPVFECGGIPSPL